MAAVSDRGTRRLRRVILAASTLWCAWFGVGAVAGAAPTSVELPPPSGPLVPVPVGCPAPAAASAVFEGEVVSVAIDSARFEVRRVLAGSLDGLFLTPGTVDVVYGQEVRFLEVGTTYTVGARLADTQRLVSAVRDPAPLFGGDAVIGLDDSDVSCPVVDDPVRTLTIDGAAVDSGVLQPLSGEGRALVRAVLLPLAVALLALFGLAAAAQSITAFGRALRDSM